MVESQNSTGSDAVSPPDASTPHTQPGTMVEFQNSTGLDAVSFSQAFTPVVDIAPQLPTPTLAPPGASVRVIILTPESQRSTDKVQKESLSMLEKVNKTPNEKSLANGRILQDIITHGVSIEKHGTKVPLFVTQKVY